MSNSKKILSLIPEHLHDDLIEEVKGVLKEKGFKVLNPGSTDTDQPTKEEVEASIAEWAKQSNKGA
ncbi:MAG: hypothetical protein U0U70_15215 [Chitinophagaceae bacterium]